MLLTTPRLSIRPWNTPQEAPEAFAIYGDREVMHFMRPPVPNPEMALAYLQKERDLSDSLANGMGFWASRKSHQSGSGFNHIITSSRRG